MKDAQDAFREFQLLLNTKELAGLESEPRPNREPLQSLEEKLDKIFAAETKTLPSAQPLICSLVLLWHDYLDESHSISQGIHNPDGSFLHGIMHRREPDYANAKYWFSRVGEHHCYPVIAEKVGEFLSSANARELKAKLIHDANWDPFAFVDACEDALRKNDEQTISILQRIQEIEFKTLLEHFLR